ncbi:HlyD family secretion protein [Poriferisphaera corsica]|uniref:HlyD family secretion protein n=1 Tax=Poriferisphaera corsica TaxID=2528020 RepID=A0A517YSS5_9BACT|nr:HlyD family efflux transporter periplasmic adaptor subunit [Poriferisphaera corsica]QDU33290.1 HlyD family secretion protein [Poriferisphaera corsica]
MIEPRKQAVVQGRQRNPKIQAKTNTNIPQSDVQRRSQNRSMSLSFDTTQWIDRLDNFQGAFPDFVKELLSVQCLVAKASAGAIIQQGAADAGGWGVIASRPVLDNKSGLPDWLNRALKDVPPINNAKQAYLKRHNVSKRNQRSEGAKLEFIIYLPLIYDNTKRVLGAFWIAVETEAVARERANQLKLTQGAYTTFELRNQLLKQEDDMKIVTRAVAVLDQFNTHQKFQAAAMALCNEIATEWRADRVSLGLRRGQYVKVIAINQTENFSRKMQLIHDIEGVMEECYDQDIEVFVPQPPDVPIISRQAKRLSDRYGPCNIYSFPLRRDDHLIGVLTAEMPLDRPLNENALEGMRLLANLIAPRVDDLEKSNKWIGLQLLESTKKAGQTIVGPTHTWVKLTGIGLLTAIVLLFTIPATDWVESSFQIDATKRQVIASPFDGYIDEVFVEPGDVVTSDQQVLASLAIGDLMLNRAALNARLAESTIDADIARREGSTVDVHIAQAKSDAIKAELGIVDDDIEDARMQSPITGIVIDGDLQPRTGGAVQRGEALFEIAPIDSLRAELYVPEDRINDVQPGQRGSLSTAASPGNYIDFTVERVEPMAEVRNGQNVFLVRVKLDTMPSWLRPGMQGLAKIDTGETNYVHRWSRGAINWLRMKLWL